MATTWNQQSRQTSASLRAVTVTSTLAYSYTTCPSTSCSRSRSRVSTFSTNTRMPRPTASAGRNRSATSLCSSAPWWAAAGARATCCVAVKLTGCWRAERRDSARSSWVSRASRRRSRAARRPAATPPPAPITPPPPDRSVARWAADRRALNVVTDRTDTH